MTIIREWCNILKRLGYVCSVPREKDFAKESQKGKGSKLKKKRKGIAIAVIIIVCLVAAGLGSLGYYLYDKVNSGLFFQDTVINGYDVYGKSCKEVLLMLEKDYSAPKIEITEQGETALSLTLAQAGYTIDERKLLDSLESCMREQNVSLLLSLMDGNRFEVEIPFSFDEEVFREAVSASKFSKKRVASTDASLEYDGKEYYIEPETYGNELDDADIQVIVKDCVDQLTAEDRPQADAKIAVPESLYFLPAVTQDDEDMNRTMNLYNSFCKAKVSLTFGETKETIDWTTLQDWLVIDGDEATISEEHVRDFVDQLAAKYNTLYLPREFTRHDGSTMTYESSDYGYQIDSEAETEQLLADLYSNTEIEREPVYAQRGYKRNGTDDICGTYVEVNLTEQHLWYYVDGKLVVESGIVSGLPRDGRETTTGVFAIPFKKSPEVLKGETWETKVTYWMPFYDGQGLHDASWQSSFGGNVYQTNGSHGCVNLPTDVAKTIYENLGEGTAIFLYK